MTMIGHQPKKAFDKTWLVVIGKNKCRDVHINLRGH